MRIPRPSRRWFQFRLRTLLIASAAVSVVFGWALVGFVQVEQRQRLLRTPGIAYDHCIPPLWGERRVRLIWYLYDAPACKEIAVEDWVDARTFERIKQLFPEADVHRGPPKQNLALRRDRSGRFHADHRP